MYLVSFETGQFDLHKLAILPRIHLHMLFRLVINDPHEL